MFHKDSIIFLTLFFAFNSIESQETCPKLSKCIRKCCADGKLFFNYSCNNFELIEEIRVHLYELTKLISVKVLKDYDRIIHGTNCPKDYITIRLEPNVEPQDVYYLQNNGNLYLPKYPRFANPEEYCIESIAFNKSHVENIVLLCVPKGDTLTSTSAVLYKIGKFNCKFFF